MKLSRYEIFNILRKANLRPVIKDHDYANQEKLSMTFLYDNENECYIECLYCKQRETVVELKIAVEYKKFNSEDTIDHMKTMKAKNKIKPLFPGFQEAMNPEGVVFLAKR